MDLATMRARVRQDLQDTDAENYRWSNDEVDGAIERAVSEFSLACPIEEEDDIATTEDCNELDISSLSKLLKVVSVEFPLDYTPPYYQHFTRYGTSIYMQDEGNGDDARVRWLKQHTLDAEGSTIPEHLEELIVLGVTGYLAISAAVYTIDKATIGGRDAASNYLKWGQARLQRYERQLRAVARDHRVIPMELYTDE
jgi:hypothetical protein